METSEPEKTSETELNLLIVLACSFFSVFAVTSIVAVVCWRKWHLGARPKEPTLDGNAVELPTLIERSDHPSKIHMSANQVGEEELTEPHEVDIEGQSDSVIICRI